MLLLFACMLAAAAAAPASYDQRQDGETNIQADFQNIFFVIAVPKKLPAGLLSALLRNSKRSGEESIAEDRADVHTMEAFVEPNTPYQVSIGSEAKKSAEADSKESNEIVIAGRRRLENHEPREEMKLLGAMEQCGPNWKRDPVTLICKSYNPTPEDEPEVVPVPT